MKNLLLIILLISGFAAQAQTDTVIYYGDTINIWRIDTAVVTNTDTISSDSNYVVQFYHYTRKDSINSFNYQPQFVIMDSLGNRILDNVDLQNVGWRASGTVMEFQIDSNLAKLTPIQLRDSLILPILKSVYGAGNVYIE